MIKFAIAYVTTAIVFLAIDFVWLSRIARGFYYGRLGDQLLAQPRIGVAAAFYLAYAAGIVLFAVMPALKAESPRLALFLGAGLGLMAYGTYDLTNYATLRHWPLPVVVVDMSWGAFLTAVSAIAGYHVSRLLSTGL